MSRFELFVASWAIVGALVFVYLATGFVGDVRQRFVERRRKRVLSVIGVVLFETEDQAEAVYDQVSDLSRRALLDVLQNLAVDLDGQAQQRVRRLVRTTGLEQFIRRRCDARRWRIRIQAAQLHHLVDHPDFDRRRLLEDRHPMVRARAAEALTPAQAAAQLDVLLPMLSAPDTVVRLAAQSAVLAAGPAAVPRLVKRLRSTIDDPLSLLEVVANLSDPRLLEALAPHVSSPDPRARMLIAQALGNDAGVGGVDVLHELLHDPDETVRATAIDALARLDALASANRIAHLLGDPSFLVRRTAGAALDRLGATGRLALRRSLESEDRFARDMARQVLDSASARIGVSLLPVSTEILIQLDESDPYAAAHDRAVDLSSYTADDITRTVHAEANRALGRVDATPGSGPLTRQEIASAFFFAITAADVIDALLGPAELVDTVNRGTR